MVMIALGKRNSQINIFSYFSAKTYVMVLFRSISLRHF